MKAILSLPNAFVGYLQNIYRELRLVEWVTPKTVLKSTIAVIAVTVIVTMLIMGIDGLLVAARSLLLNQGI